MNRRILFALLVIASAAAGCIQRLDSGLTSGGVSGISSTSDPVAQGVEQCEAGSAECFALCGSPLCALLDGAIPAALYSPPIYTPNGIAQDPCDAVRKESMAIRQRSCTPCHLPLYNKVVAGFTYVLEDGKLVVGSSQHFSNEAGALRYVVPGDPEGSFAYQRTMSGLAGSPQGMPPPEDQCIGLLGREAGAGIVRPTSEDLSVLYEWITNCVDGTDGGAYAASYYGAFYGPGGPGSDAGAAWGETGAKGDSGATSPVQDGGNARPDSTLPESGTPVDAGASRSPSDAGRG